MVSFVENSASIGSLVSKKLGLILQRRFILAPNVTQTEHLGAGPIWYSQSTSLLNTWQKDKTPGSWNVFGYHLVGRHSVWQQGAFNIGLDLQQLLGFCRGSLRGLSGGTWVYYTLSRCSARKFILRAGEKLDLFLELAIGREMYTMI